MADETVYKGFESVPSEGYLQPDRVKVWFACNRCGHEYSRIYKTIPQKDSPCPKQACKDALATERFLSGVENVKGILESRQTPGISGLNMKNRLIDVHAADLMQDYGLTDLKDNLRMGDTMVPPLPKDMQKAADNFFTAPQGKNPEQVQKYRTAAVGGGYSDPGVSSKAFFPPRESTMPKPK